MVKVSAKLLALLVALVLVVAFPAAIGAQQQHACTKQVSKQVVSAGAGGATVVVAGVAGLTTMICSLTLTSDTASANFSVIEGTGAACATNTLGIIGDGTNLMTVKIGMEIDGFSETPVWRTVVPGNDFCLKLGAAASIMTIAVSFLQV